MRFARVRVYSFVNTQKACDDAHIAAYSCIMQVTINGENRSFDAPLTIDRLISEMGLSVDKLAIEVNLAIIPCAAHTTTWLAEGDCVEIVHFIGGG